MLPPNFHPIKSRSPQQKNKEKGVARLFHLRNSHPIYEVLDQHTHSTLRIYAQGQSKQECRALQSGITHWWTNESPRTTTISPDSSGITPKPQTQKKKIKRFTMNPAVSVAVAVTIQGGNMIKIGASDHRQSWSSKASLKSGVDEAQGRRIRGRCAREQEHSPQTNRLVRCASVERFVDEACVPSRSRSYCRFLVCLAGGTRRAGPGFLVHGWHSFLMMALLSWLNYRCSSLLQHYWLRYVGIVWFVFNMFPNLYQ